MIEVIESGWVTQVNMAQSGLGQLGAVQLGVGQLGATSLGVEPEGVRYFGHFFSLGLDVLLTVLTASYLSFLLLQETVRKFYRGDTSSRAVKGPFRGWGQQFNRWGVDGWRASAALREKRSLRHQHVSGSC